MTYYKVTGKATVYHICNCRHCFYPLKQPVNISIVVQVAEDSEPSAILSEALRKQYRVLHLIDETDDLRWLEGSESEIREANTDEIMAAIEAPRLPGF